PLQLRDHGHQQGRRAAGADIFEPARPRRHRRKSAAGRRRAVRPAPLDLRFRHDRIPLGAVAVARQRAGLLLGLGGGRSAGHAQLYGRQKRRHRRHDRRHAARRRPRRLCRRRARARPRADLRLLCGAAVLSAAAMGGALDLCRASGADFAVRFSARDLVASAGQTRICAAMILGATLGTVPGEPASGAAPPQQGASRITIDEIFRRVAQRRPEALALVDAPNRKTFTDGAPRRLTFAQADRVVSAIAGRLRHMGLPTDSIIGIQLPNIAENILAILGVMRAGMIAAPLPLLWRRADAVTALSRVDAKALITCGHVGGFDHCQLAMRIAADVFSIRYVCGFGAGLPDGVVPFDDLFTAQKLDPVPPLERERASNPAAHLAAITFDSGEAGVIPVARSHLQLLAGGLGVLLESLLVEDAPQLSTLAPSSFAGICLTLLPWLLSGGKLSLHHPFDPPVLFGQWRGDDRCGALVIPGPVAFRLAEAGVFSRTGPACVLAPWRSPERLGTSPDWRERDTVLVD